MVTEVTVLVRVANKFGVLNKDSSNRFQIKATLTRVSVFYCGQAAVAPTECTWENTAWTPTTRVVPSPSAPPRSSSTPTGTLTESGGLSHFPSSCLVDCWWVYPCSLRSVCNCVVCIHTLVTTLPWSSWRLPSPSLIPSWLPVFPPLETSCPTMLPATWLAGAVFGVSSTRQRKKKK